MPKFIYVFDTDGRDILLSFGYPLLKSDTKNKVYVFENLGVANFDIAEINAAMSNTLTF